MNDKQKFSAYTKLLRGKFPTWSKIRKDPNAIGSQFLSVIGVQLDEVEWMINYAYEQTHIRTADISQTDIIYKARIPNSLGADTEFRFSSDSHILHDAVEMMNFLKVTKADSSLQYDTSYYIDFNDKYIYVKHPFGATDTYKDGHLILTIADQFGKEIYTESIPLMLHPVWNFFDEFGLLLDTQRLYGERNAAYKERILDVFRRPASSAYRGLVNGIARELGLVQEISWEDGGTDLVLYSTRINAKTILVDDEKYPEEFIREDISGRVILEGMETQVGTKRQVRYIAGVDLHELHNEEDILQSELYTIDGHATNLLHYYVETVRNHVPIMWGQWKWDQGFWNISDESMSGFGYLPTTHDGSIAGWKRYTPREG